MRFWLEKEGVKGFRIGDFNYLFEDFNNPDVIVSDVNKTMAFLQDMRELARKYSQQDGLEMYSTHFPKSSKRLQ